MGVVLFVGLVDFVVCIGVAKLLTLCNLAILDPPGGETTGAVETREEAVMLQCAQVVAPPLHAMEFEAVAVDDGQDANAVEVSEELQILVLLRVVEDGGGTDTRVRDFDELKATVKQESRDVQ